MQPKKLFSLRVCVGLMALMAAVTVGCDGGPKKKVVPVEGKLLFSDGKPLPAGTRLLFTPGEGDTGTAKGVTAEDGSFKVTHVSGGRGAELGKYAILLAAPEGEQATFLKVIPKEYYEGGVFFAEVKEGMAPLDLKVKKKR